MEQLEDPCLPSDNWENTKTRMYLDLRSSEIPPTKVSPGISLPERESNVIRRQSYPHSRSALKGLPPPNEILSHAFLIYIGSRFLSSKRETGSAVTQVSDRGRLHFAAQVGGFSAGYQFSGFIYRGLPRHPRNTLALDLWKVNSIGFLPPSNLTSPFSPPSYNEFRSAAVQQLKQVGHKRGRAHCSLQESLYRSHHHEDEHGRWLSTR